MNSYLLDIHTPEGTHLLNEPELRGFLLIKQNRGLGAVVSSDQTHYFETLEEAVLYKKAHKRRTKYAKILDVRKYIVRGEKIDARLLYGVFKITHLPLSTAALEFMALGKAQIEAEKHTLGQITNFTVIGLGFIFCFFILTKRIVNSELNFTDSLLILFNIFVIAKVVFYVKQRQNSKRKALEGDLEKQKTHRNIA